MSRKDIRQEKSFLFLAILKWMVCLSESELYSSERYEVHNQSSEVQNMAQIKAEWFESFCFSTKKIK
jgi:hypothetical protein